MKTILVVEDNDSIRLLAVQFLKRGGYPVLEAASGEEAVTLWKERATDIGLLFTDLNMDQMNGVDLADKLEALSPGMKTLFTSGHDEGPVEEIPESLRPFHFLPKPYSHQQLLEAVKNALAD